MSKFSMTVFALALVGLIFALFVEVRAKRREKAFEAANEKVREAARARVSTINTMNIPRPPVRMDSQQHAYERQRVNLYPSSVASNLPKARTTPVPDSSKRSESSAQDDWATSLVNPLNPLSPLSIYNSAQEPSSSSSSHCSPSHSSHDHGSSSSSSYDSGSSSSSSSDSSSWSSSDCGSSSSSSDW